MAWQGLHEVAEVATHLVAGGDVVLGPARRDVGRRAPPSRGGPAPRSGPSSADALAAVRRRRARARADAAAAALGAGVGPYVQPACGDRSAGRDAGGDQAAAGDRGATEEPAPREGGVDEIGEGQGVLRLSYPWPRW